MTVATATIDAEGTQYSLTDSGPLDSKHYETLIMFHGSMFNGETFEPLVHSFNKHSVRIINVSRRGYGTTSAHSATDIANLAKGSNEFFRVLAKDVASLFLWILENLGPFRKHSLSILSWSMGSSTTLAVLGQRDVVPKESYDKIEAHLSKLVLYGMYIRATRLSAYLRVTDSPLTAFGFDIPDHDDLYNPFLDRSFATIPEFSDNVNMYLSSYFDHPDPQSGHLRGVDWSRNGVRPSMGRMTADDRLRFMESKAAASGADAGTVPYCPELQRTLREQADIALFNPSLILPNVSITTIGCMSSAWFLLWAFLELRRRYDDFVKKGGKPRAISFVELPNVNHFAHYDAPDEFVACVCKIIQ